MHWPADMGLDDADPCQCGALVGFLHHAECKLELCPWADAHPDAGEQLMFCGCLSE